MKLSRLIQKLEAHFSAFGDTDVPDNIVSGLGLLQNDGLRVPISRLVSSDELCEKFNKNSRGLSYLMRRENNPLPAPVSGGAGYGNKRHWALADIIAWELEEYGVRTIPDSWSEPEPTGTHHRHD
ncbi:MAG: hypothetical protein ACPGSM_12945 [Thiolinea sp.]